MSSSEAQWLEEFNIQNIGVDTSQAYEDLAQLEMQAAVVTASVVKSSRKGYESIALLLDIAGIAIPQTIQLFASAAFLAAETLVQLATAETITVVLAAKAIMTFTMAGILFSRAIFLRGEAMRQQQTLNSLIQLHGVWF